MRLAINHLTQYTLERPGAFVLQEVRLTPATDAGQRVETWRVSIECGAVEASFDDHNGNRTMLFSRDGGEGPLRLRAEGIVETTDRAGVVGPHRGFAPLWLYRRETPLTAPGGRVRALVAAIEPASDIARLHALMNAVADAVRYDKSADPLMTAEASLEAGQGVCQDHAHVFIAAARLLGFPARYVSAYLFMADGSGQEASHAFAEAHLEGLGWVGFDPANRQSPDARYVRIASGLDYHDAAPVRGLRIGAGGAEKLAVNVQVQQ
ncbi:MAG: transglutaminase family protein [Parvularculaceae bacterium]|nr:transglutaminase family protein [Parvularculaceae bacterium]